MDARWFFYAWFLMVVFVLDWARTGLANVEASALMHPRLAPRSAMELMWHVDSNWSNVLWWLRGLRNVIFRPVSRLGLASHHQSLMSRPGLLWWFLSATTLLLFLAVPLSGLTMELTDAFVRSSKHALILGPNPETFNNKGYINLPQQIWANWRSGRPTTPLDKSILYAPVGTLDVSTSYYDDMINSDRRNTTIQIFAGPAVDQVVFGNAWGLEANISCRQVRKEDLTLISVGGFGDYGILISHKGDERFLPSRNLSGKPEGGPIWINETGQHCDKSVYSLVVAAEGSHYGLSPYEVSTNQDGATRDWFTRPKSEVTIAIFEAFLWQGLTEGYQDDHMTELLQSKSEIVTIRNISYYESFGKFVPANVSGFGIHCEVQSAVGNATVGPAHHTYSGFQRGVSAVPHGGDQSLYPIQIQALEALGRYDQLSYDLQPRNANYSDSTWLATHLAIGLLPHGVTPASNRPGWRPNDYIYPALTPEHLQLGIHKLLGEAVIAVMDKGGQDGWEGNLYIVEPVKYLRRGIIPWQYVLVMLSLWTLLTVSASLWMLFQKRWATTLNGFELFKFGTQCRDDLTHLKGMQFQECKCLRRIPGMVGMIPGTKPMSSYGFIGLSELPAHKKATYVYDQAEAGLAP